MLRLDKISKAFGTEAVIRDVSLGIEREKSLVILGPSGCGKTTLLRLIAGFDRPDDGTITINGEIVSSPEKIVPPHRRNLGFVFQDLALWPHMTVGQNVEFGLRAKRLAAGQRHELVSAVLEQVSLNGQRSRYPGQLSGGERQRVALARAIVGEPKLILFDEPLSNLEPTLRRDLCSMVRDMNCSRHLTSVYVTHNRTEAFLMADHLAIMKDGQIVQTGLPAEVVHRPINKFVASFLDD